MSDGCPPSLERTRRVAFAVAVLSIVFQGFGPIFVRKAAMSGIAFAFHRMWMAALLYSVLSFASGRPITRRALWVSAPGGLFFAFNIAIFFVSVQRTSVANATVIGALQPAVLMLVGARMFGERTSGREVLWTAVSFVGAAVVVFGSSSAETGDLYGDFLAFVAMLDFAGYFAASKRARETLGALEYQSALSLVACVALVPVVALADTDLSAPRPASWVWIAGMVALPGTGHLMTNYAHAYVRLSVMSVLTLLAPGISAIAAWVLLDERLVLIQVMGMVITVAALAIMVSPPRHLHRARSG